jgi:NAD-dependent SIR2 family protein deacetylase
MRQNEFVPGSALSALARFITTHRVVVLTGAGCSTGSGIPDYRDVNGERKHAQPMTYQQFSGSEAARQRYWARSFAGWARIANAAPNPAHHAIAALEAAGFVHAVITQNVDGLHTRAGSRRVIDLHGRLDTVRCLACGDLTSRDAFQTRLLERNPQLAGRQVATAAPDGDARLTDVDYTTVDVPACTACGGILKPHVVFFGEGVPPARTATAFERLEEADALLVVGSSLMVYSGYRFALAAARDAKPIAAVNLGRTRADGVIGLKLEAECGEALSALARELAGTRTASSIDATLAVRP